MIGTIILDLDGPVLDGRFRHYQCYCDILVENGYVPMPLGEYWETKRQCFDRRRQLAISGADGIYDEFMLAWLERIEQKKYLSLDRLQPGAVARLQNWRIAGMTLILMTMRNNPDNLHWQLDSLNIAPLFDSIIAVGNLGGGTGKAAAAQTLIAQTDLATVAWIGDTEADIEAARALGVTACVVGCGLRTIDYLATRAPDYLFPDLDSVIFLH